MRRSTGVLVLLLILFFLFKVLRFQTLAYTFHDMYVFAQMATSWIDGRPFMYDNFWGYHQRIHNYYTVWLWGPLVYQFGVYGLFLVQALLLLIAYGLTNQRLARAGIPNWLRYGLLGVVLLGPVSFWLNDHTSMAWHSELTYLPFGLLFALSLTGRGWGWPILAGLGVTLVKEDGAVLAAMIHLSFFGITHLRRHPGRSLWHLLADRRFWFIGLGWAAVFMAGIFWLGYLNQFAEPRLRMALEVIVRNSDTKKFWIRAAREIGFSLLLLVPPSCLLGLVNRQLALPVANRLWLLYGLGISALLAMNFVQGAFYYDDPYPPAYHLLGLTWPPRFVLPWTFVIAFLVTILVMLPLHARAAPTRLPVWLALGGLFLLQLPILKLVRPDFPGFSESRALVQGEASPFKDRRYLDPADLAKLECLSEHLPPRSDVMAYEYALPYFHKHYLIWTTGHHHPYQQADVAVIPINPKPEFRARLAESIALDIRRPYRIIRLKGYLIYVAADYEQFVGACIR